MFHLNTVARVLHCAVCIFAISVSFYSSIRDPPRLGRPQRILVSTPLQYFSVLFDLRDRDGLSIYKGQIVGPIVPLVWRFHCIRELSMTLSPLSLSLSLSLQESSDS